MFTKGAKPRTHLLIDLCLFSLLTSLAFSALAMHVVSKQTHLHFMLHAFHEMAGILMCLTVSLHLLLHLPWIRSQLPRLLKTQH